MNLPISASVCVAVVASVTVVTVALSQGVPPRFDEPLPDLNFRCQDGQHCATEGCYELDYLDTDHAKDTPVTYYGCTQNKIADDGCSHAVAGQDALAVCALVQRYASQGENGCATLVGNPITRGSGSLCFSNCPISHELVNPRFTFIGGRCKY